MTYDREIIKEFVINILERPEQIEDTVFVDMPLSKLREIALILSKDYNIERPYCSERRCEEE